jgi:predicted permease
MGKLWRQVYYLLHRRRLERELTEEMNAHREMMPPDRRARFGSTGRLGEDSREVWTWPWLDQLWQDLCYGARVLSHAPGFTLGAVAVLALGVGVNLAEFQIFDALIFHRLDIRDAGSVLELNRITRHRRQPGFPNGAFEFYQAHSLSFAWLVAEDSNLDVVVETDPDIRGTLVSGNYFPSLGLVPAWGRLPDVHDAEAGAAPVVALGYDYWRTRWGADPNVIGRIIHVNGHPMQVIGVAPYNFPRGLFGVRTEIWLPISVRPLLMPSAPPLENDFARPDEALFGKLKPGVSLAACEGELTSLTHELARRQPLAFSNEERMETSLVQQPVGQSVRRNPAIAIFLVMILLVLISACANLGNMLLARGLARQREMQIRVAIGAGRARIVRQLMTENILLALLGAAAGLAFGNAASRLLLSAMGAPFFIRIRVDGPIILAAVVLTLFSALVFGLPSALQTVRGSQRKMHLRQSLIGVQVAVSCLLLIASSVLAHNGIANASVDLAFDYRNMLIVYPQLYGRNLTPAAARQKLEALTDRMKALPGVEGVTAAVVPPLAGRIRMDTPPGLPHVYRNAVAASYFAVMQLPLVRGRTFQPGEPDALVVSESAARAVWPNQDPLGKVWKLGGLDRTVVGVVKDSGVNLLADDTSVEVYTPIEGADLLRSALIVHTPGDPGPLVRLVPGAAAEVNEVVGATLMRTARDLLIDTEGRIVTLIGSIGAVATILAAAGMFALVAFTVAQRTREIGIRIAIGAGPRHILDVLLRQNVRPTLIGAVAGVLLAVILQRLVRNQIPLQHVETIDVAGFAGGLAGFAVVAALASLSPALRALRIDPSTTLREQ